MAIYERGETFSHWVTIRDKDDTKVDPSTVSMEIIDPNNNTVLSASAMTKDAVGEYYYDYDLSSTASYGKYSVKVISTSAAGRVGILDDEFFIMPWKLEEGIRRKMGSSEKDIGDEDLSHIAWTSYKEALQEVYHHRYRDIPLGNPDTGAKFNGSNTSFKTKYYPIADIGGDGTVGDSSDDDPDITCWWIDNAGHRNTGYVSITEVNNGEINIYQSDGVTAIPADNEGVYLEYWTENDRYNDFIFQEAVSYLSAHYVNLRFTERDKVTITDLNSNRPIILKYPNRFIKEYRRLLGLIVKPKISGVK